MIRTLFLLLLATPALAQDDGLTTWGDLRWIASEVSDFEVDAEGTTLGQGAWVDQRLRIGGALPIGISKLETEWELSTAQLFGDTWDLPGTEDARGRGWRRTRVLPRTLAATTYLGNFQVQAGLVTSHWGLGILANDGAHDPWFGRTDFGDRVVRLRLTRIPYESGPPPRISQFTTVAVDWVIEDDIGALHDGQLAFQAIVSSLWKGREGRQWGAYSVFRQQRERNRQQQTNALAVDIFADGNWDLGNWNLRLAGEGAVLAGRTNRSSSYTSRDSLAIAQVGAAGLAHLTSPDSVLEFRLRAAYASGDGNPDDGLAADFRFDRDFSAGTVTFDQVVGAVDVATHALLTDPDIAGKPPDGVDVLVSEGAFHRAAFVQPSASARILPFAHLRLGATFSVATAPFTQPFYTYRAGGSPRTYRNTLANGRLLGTEINTSLRFSNLGEGAVFQPTFELQTGHLIAGPALQAGVCGMTVHHMMAIARVQW